MNKEKVNLEKLECDVIFEDDSDKFYSSEVKEMFRSEKS